jgi:uncharacterized protein (DUF433 family)
MNWWNDVTVDPGICHGKACITGTRVLVSVVLDNLAVGVSVDETPRSHPSLTRQSFQAAMSYAAELACERVVLMPA